MNIAIMRNQGGVMSVAQLQRLGATEGEIRSAVRAGILRRVRHGWLCTADADPDIVGAVTAGGRLGCISAAEHHGLWVPAHTGLHVSMPVHAGRHSTSSVIAHWEGARWRDAAKPVEPIDRVIRQVILCCDREEAISVIDSALHRKKMSMVALECIVASLPREYRAIVDEVDPASESGYETMCRVRLARLRLPIRTQVELRGIGRVDLLIGERLIIEADGKEWHQGEEAFFVDRSRDLAALRQSYLPMRLAPAHIDHEWGWVERVVNAIVDRREHNWSSAQLRQRARDGFGG